jgi:hypothetical protein
LVEEQANKKMAYAAAKNIFFILQLFNVERMYNNGAKKNYTVTVGSMLK